MEQGVKITNVELDPGRQVRAKEYARLNRRLMVVDMVITAIYFLAWLVLGWSGALKDWLMQYTSNEWLLVFLFVLSIGGILFLINLPLSYYQGFILPHRYELSTQTVRGWVIDQVKGILVGGVLGLIVLEIIYAVLRAYPTYWWLIAAAILLIFNVILANLAPTLLMPLFNKFTPLGEEHAELAERLVQLAKRSGTYVRGVFSFDMSRRTKEANAGLTGLGNSRRIIIGDTLLKEFSSDEIETIMAHELGHQVNKDIPLSIIFGSITTLVGLYLASLALNWGVSAFGFSSSGDIAAFPLFVLVLGVFGLVSMPLENGFSRWRESKADQYALALTLNGSAFASALRRLANQNLADADPEPWVEWLLYSHPAIGKRIAMAEQDAHHKGS
ncbi:MAG: peptidase [Anaerolineales bacterium]|nr:M48 family metallopeptidase [Anaerolineae bacterium]PWB53243.1 MAG: peptidase [Anaerolineales bacterium]